MTANAAAIRRMGLAQHSARMARARSEPGRRRRPSNVIQAFIGAGGNAATGRSTRW